MIWGEETIGQRVRRLREERSLTQKDLVQLTGLSEITINRIETGSTKIIVEFIERLAGALQVSKDYLRRGDTPADRETLQTIDALCQEHNITSAEADRLRELASGAIKQRNNAKVPLNRLEIEVLLMVIRGG